MRNGAFGILVGVMIVAGLLGLPAWSAATGCEEPAKQLAGVASNTGNWNDYVNGVSGGLNPGQRLGVPLKRANVLGIVAQAMCGCVGSEDAYGCAKQAIKDRAICIAATAAGAPNPNNPFNFFPQPQARAALVALYEILAAPKNPYCDTPPSAPDGGGGAFKCCKYEPDQLGCHSAFNTPMPVNCEGAALFTDLSPQSFGVCMQSPGMTVGCTCNHLPECTFSGGPPDDSDFARNFRRSLWFGDLSAAYQEAVFGTGAGPAPSCGLDFGLFVGCRGWLEVLRGAHPYTLVQDGDTIPDGDELTQLNYSLVGNAVQRVIFAIPNGLARHDYVAERVWSAQEKRDYLGSVDPEVELGGRLSDCGMELLQASLPERWSLLAVPHPGEDVVEETQPMNWQDGCVQGELPASLTLTVHGGGGEVSVTAAVVDPEARYDSFGQLPIFIDWGDDTSTSHVYDHASSASNTYGHRYAAAGSYAIRATYTNSAGLSLAADAGVDATAGSSVQRLRYVAGVAAGASMASSDAAYVDLFVEDAYGGLHLLRRDRAPSTGGTTVALASNAMVPTRFPIEARRLVWKVSIQGGGSGSYYVDSLGVLPHRSEGSAAPTSLSLSAADFASDGTGAEPGSDGGRISLPLVAGVTYSYELPQN